MQVSMVDEIRSMRPVEAILSLDFTKNLQMPKRLPEKAI